MRKLLIGMIVLSASVAVAADPAGFPSESAYDTTVHSDDAAVNVRIRNHRWPDCYSTETAGKIDH